MGPMSRNQPARPGQEESGLVIQQPGECQKELVKSLWLVLK